MQKQSSNPPPPILSEPFEPIIQLGLPPPHSHIISNTFKSINLSNNNNNNNKQCENKSEQLSDIEKTKGIGLYKICFCLILLLCIQIAFSNVCVLINMEGADGTCNETHHKSKGIVIVVYII